MGGGRGGREGGKRGDREHEALCMWRERGKGRVGVGYKRGREEEREGGGEVGRRGGRWRE